LGEHSSECQSVFNVKQLHTGATVSIVDQRIADKFKSDRRPAQSFNIDRKLKWESATLPDLQFRPVHATNVIIFVGRLAQYSEFARNADAVIGMDLLRFSNLGIDFEARKITFHPSRIRFNLGRRSLNGNVARAPSDDTFRRALPSRMPIGIEATSEAWEALNMLIPFSSRSRGSSMQNSIAGERLDTGGAREREEKEVVVLARTRVELIDSRKVFETSPCRAVLPLRRLFPLTLCLAKIQSLRETGRFFL
jgi:hypothetical protein